MSSLCRRPLMAATRLTAGTSCGAGAGDSEDGLSCRRLCGGEVVVCMARMRLQPTKINSTRLAADAAAARAVAGSCGSDMAAGSCICFTGAGAGAGAGGGRGGSAGVVLVLNLLLFTRNGARPPDGGGSAVSRYVTWMRTQHITN